MGDSPDALHDQIEEDAIYAREHQPVGGRGRRPGARHAAGPDARVPRGAGRERRSTRSVPAASFWAPGATARDADVIDESPSGLTAQTLRAATVWIPVAPSADGSGGSGRRRAARDPRTTSQAPRSRRQSRWRALTGRRLAHSQRSSFLAGAASRAGSEVAGGRARGCSAASQKLGYGRSPHPRTRGSAQEQREWCAWSSSVKRVAASYDRASELCDPPPDPRIGDGRR
jgi:hypothetical protein